MGPAGGGDNNVFGLIRGTVKVNKSSCREGHTKGWVKFTQAYGTALARLFF